MARLKSGADWAEAIEAAVRFYEEPPTRSMTIETDWADVRLSAADWAEAFDAAEPGATHNEARDVVWDALIAILIDQHAGDVPADQLRRSLIKNAGLRDAFNHAWPLIDATDLVADLWSVPAYLRRCAPWLDRDEIRALQRTESQAWTVSDLPLLDAARHRLGDPEASKRKQREQRQLAAEQEEMTKVIDDLIASDDSELQVMSMLRRPDLQYVLIDERAPTTNPDHLAGPFAHIVVDEAQELTDAEWQMLLRRCPSRSFTVVGDRAQARHGFAESWRERLERVGFDDVAVSPLNINYRTPTEVMAQAEPVIRAVLPDANVPTSIRDGGLPVVHGVRKDLDRILNAWLAEYAEGIACVIGAGTFASTPRVRSLTPELSKGLEFDLVVLIDPEGWGSGTEAAVDRYVAMTRATQQLVILTS